MFDNLFSLAPEIGHAIAETGLMLLISVSAAVLIGIPIGVFSVFYRQRTNL